MAAISLFELNEFIRRIMALNFPEAIWVRGEIAQLNNSRGHRYIDLIEKEAEGEDIIAKAHAVIWEGEYNRLKRKIGKNLEDILQEGMEVMLNVKVDFHEQYGFKLIVQNIDPAFTLGKLELKRRETINKLRKLGLIGKNKETELPQVIQRIAVISSARAAGFKDYLNHLSKNQFGYTFRNRLLNAAVQGIHASKEIVERLNQIALRADEFDCVVIIRGGGAKMDLLAFDDYDLSELSANFPIPILTGIGHDVDETVLQLVVYSPLKTPTAVADFIIDHNMRFESQLEELKIFLQQITGIHLMQSDRILEQFQQKVQFGFEQNIQKANTGLEQFKDIIPLLRNKHLARELARLEKLGEMVHLLDPLTSLQRGFSLTTFKKKIIKSTEEVQAGDEIETRLLKGTLKSKVIDNG